MLNSIPRPSHGVTALNGWLRNASSEDKRDYSMQKCLITDC